MKFSDAELSRIRTALLAEGSQNLIQYMHHRALALPTNDLGQAPEALAHDLGWLEPTGRRTKLGICASDSCREYLFWLERKRVLPFERAAPHLDIEGFRNRKVLEIGSGMGTNLMSFALQGADVVGVEPVEAYAQMGSIFCEREGLSFTETRQGAAEKLPFEDNEVDLILCVSAHQYFDLRPALKEMARVLKPGGEAIIIGGTLDTYFWGTLAELPSNPRAAKGWIITTLNTLSYTWFDHRVLPAKEGFSTARPIYPGKNAMMRMLRLAAGSQSSRLLENTRRKERGRRLSPVFRAWFWD